MTTPADSNLTEYFVEGEDIYCGQFLRLRRDRVTLPDGKNAYREYVRHPGAVVILAFEEKDGRETLALVRQFRYPLGRVFIEAPAGKLESGELPLDCAKRELREECGYEAQEWSSCGSFHPCIGYSDEEIHIFTARKLTKSTPALAEGEFLHNISMSLEEIAQHVADGAITDGKTLAALARWRRLA